MVAGHQLKRKHLTDLGVDIIAPVGLWCVRVTQISEGEVETGVRARDEVQSSGRNLARAVIPCRGEDEAAGSFADFGILRSWFGACLRPLATHRRYNGDEGD